MTRQEIQVQSPIGPLLLRAEGSSLTGIEFLAKKGPSAADAPTPGDDFDALTVVEGAGLAPGVAPPSPVPSPFDRILREAVVQLEAYFAGELTDFDLPLEPRGTDFQLATWEALLEIPYGETISYAELARRIGKPAAVRAVGAANGANPLPIVIPCHRVIGSDGRLVGYGGGLEIKRFLLALEQGTLF